MSERRPDDPHLEPDLRTALRQHASESPRAEIDARILAAAHRAVDSRPRSTGLRRWLPRIDTPFATAAVVMVSAALLLLMREQGHFEGPVLKEIERQAAPATTGSSAPAATSPAPSATPPDTTPPMPSPPTDSDMPATRDTGAAELAAPAGSGVASPPAASAARPESMLGKQNAADGAIGEPREGSIGQEETATAPREETVLDAAPAASVEPQAVDRASATAQPFPAGDAKRSAGAAPSEGSATAPHRAEPGTDKKPAAAILAAPPAVTGPEAATMSAPVEAAAADRESRDAMLTDRAKSEAVPVPTVEQEKALQTIRALIRSERFSDARLALARFVKDYPDFRVPADILQALKPAD